MIGMHADGGFTVFWHDYITTVPYDVGMFGQQFDATGARVGGEFFIERNPNGALCFIATAPNGDFVLLKEPNNSLTLLLERFNSAGVQQGTAVNVTDSLNSSAWPTVTVDSLGNAIVVYAANHGGRALFVRRFNAAGIPLGPEARADVGATTDAFGPSVAAGPNGYVVAWSGPSARFFRTATAGDANGDGNVDFNDLVRLAQNYNATGGKTWADGDFNGDGRVDFNDLVLIAQKYNTSTSGAPQPASVSFPEALATAFAKPATKTVDMPSSTPKSAAHPSRPVPKPRPLTTPRQVAKPAPRPVTPPKRPSVAAPASRTSSPDPTGAAIRTDARPRGVFSTHRVSRGSSVKELLE
jgi:hypothetical protein